MTPADLARLTEEERAIAESLRVMTDSGCWQVGVIPSLDYVRDLELLLTHLALARRVVEAARLMPPSGWAWDPGEQELLAALAAHDAEAGR